MVQRVLQWGRQDVRYSRKRNGPMAEKYRYNIFFNDFIGGLYMQLFPLGNAPKAHFSTSIWCDESWEACPPFMCLDHIIAHETYQLFHVLPLKLAPTCFIRQCGTFKTQEFECTIVFRVYQLDMFGIWGLVIYCWNVLKIPFQWCITSPVNLKITIAKQKQKN
jgi:hypothetical protein